MEKYIFICIGTNLLIEDSFGPKVGEILNKNFLSHPNIQILGTINCPVHFQNAPIFIDYLKQYHGKLILIDSALGKNEEIGSIYISPGGTKIGKAFEKSFYFPAHLSIKMVVGNKKEKQVEMKEKEKIINSLAQSLATTITNGMYQIL